MGGVNFMDEVFFWKSRFTYERNLPTDCISVAKQRCVQNCNHIRNTCRYVTHSLLTILIIHSIQLQCAHRFQTQSQLMLLTSAYV